MMTLEPIRSGTGTHDSGGHDRAPAPAVVVFACGERLRGDDGVAHAAADALPLRARTGIDVRRVSAVGPEDLAGLSPDTTSIIVDAVVGIAPGSIVRFDLVHLPTDRSVRPTSSHQLPLDMVAGLAKLMGWTPRGVFLGVGCVRFDHGATLSPEVGRAIPALAEAIAVEVERARLTGPAPAPSEELP